MVADDVPSNLTRLSGRLLERGALRRTPAGIPVLEFTLLHSSTQFESDCRRKVECEVNCVAAGQSAQVLVAIKPGDALRLSGFLAARSLKQRNLILHVNTVEFIEGTENGFQTKE